MAYEMRISYWSSDVCSSDLRIIVVIHFPEHCLGNRLLVFGPLLRPPSRREAIDRAEIMFPIGVIVSVEPGKSHDRRQCRKAVGIGKGLKPWRDVGNGSRAGIATAMGRASGRERVCQYG